MSTEPTFPFGQAIVWQPDPAWLASSNLRAFMDRHGISGYEALHARARGDIAWFWDAAIADLGIEFYTPYTQVLDLSEGVEFPRWCVGGKLNIIHNCLDKWQATPTRERVALRSALPTLSPGRHTITLDARFAGDVPPSLELRLRGSGTPEVARAASR